MSGLDAVILAGGRAERLDGASKPDLVVGGRRLLATAIAAARSAGCDRVVVVGPTELEAPGCLVVREDPPFGGPVAALAAGLAALDASGGRVAPGGRVPRPYARSRDAAARLLDQQGGDVLVLACDMPEAVAAVARVVSARVAAPEPDGVCLVDASGRTQWLAAVYARDALARACDALAERDADHGTLHGAAMRRLAASLDLAVVADDGTTHDIDTWRDLAEARRRTGGTTMSESQHPEVLDEWVVEAAALVGIDPADVPIGTVLELARRAAHGVARPAAPVTTFLLGLAVGSGRSADDLDTLADRLGALAEQHGTAGGGAAM
jgi:molybdopterin-guanine dinucleotide biosynthesis protein A